VRRSDLLSTAGKPPSSLVIEKIEYDVAGMTVLIDWSSTTADRIAVLNNSAGCLDWSSTGGRYINDTNDDNDPEWGSIIFNTTIDAFGASDIDLPLKNKVRELSAGGTVTDSLVRQAFNELPEEVKSTPGYRKAAAELRRVSQYEIKKGIPSDPGELKALIMQAAAEGNIPAAEFMEIDGDAFKVKDSKGQETVQFEDEIKNPKYKGKNVLVTRTDSKGNKVVSSVWAITEENGEHSNQNRLGSSKRLDVARTRSPEEIAMLNKIEEDVNASSMAKKSPKRLGQKI
jgi:hypothetical protein